MRPPCHRVRAIYEIDPKRYGLRGLAGVSWSFYMRQQWRIFEISINFLDYNLIKSRRYSHAPIFQNENVYSLVR